ncbi:hypothetical protein N2152v2_003111 [Parachlorella kessleri]
MTAVEVPVCKHWRSRGFCLFGGKCVFQHPPELAAAVAQQAALRAAQAAPGSNAALRAGARPEGGYKRHRLRVRNRFRAGAFRRFLIDTYGRERLRAGAGVLDVAGGKGELAFELVNLNNIPATVLEPRGLELEKRVRWLKSGYYHWNSIFSGYNDRQWISKSLEEEAAAARAAGAAASIAGIAPEQAQQPAPSAPSCEQRAAFEHSTAGPGMIRAGSLLFPRHLRAVITRDLCQQLGLDVAVCMGAPAPAATLPSKAGQEPKHGQSSPGQPAPLDAAGAAGSAWARAQAPPMPPGWWAALQQAREQAQHSRWTRKGLEHESPAAAEAAMTEAEGYEYESDQGGGESSEACSVLSLTTSTAALDARLAVHGTEQGSCNGVAGSHFDVVGASHAPPTAGACTASRRYPLIQAAALQGAAAPAPAGQGEAAGGAPVGSLDAAATPAGCFRDDLFARIGNGTAQPCAVPPPAVPPPAAVPSAVPHPGLAQAPVSGAGVRAASGVAAQRAQQGRRDSRPEAGASKSGPRAAHSAGVGRFLDELFTQMDLEAQHGAQHSIAATGTATAAPCKEQEVPLQGAQEPPQLLQAKLRVGPQHAAAQRLQPVADGEAAVLTGVQPTGATQNPAQHSSPSMEDSHGPGPDHFAGVGAFLDGLFADTEQVEETETTQAGFDRGVSSRTGAEVGSATQPAGAHPASPATGATREASPVGCLIGGRDGGQGWEATRAVGGVAAVLEGIYARMEGEQAQAVQPSTGSSQRAGAPAAAGAAAGHVREERAGSQQQGLAMPVQPDEQAGGFLGELLCSVHAVPAPGMHSNGRRDQDAASTGAAAVAAPKQRAGLELLETPWPPRSPPAGGAAAAGMQAAAPGAPTGAAAAEGGHGLPAAAVREVVDAEEAWRLLTGCSIVVGMHPDQATEFIVDLALKYGRPFAVVPCCVYAAEFPKRKLRGKSVTHYQQLVDYLVSKAPDCIQVAELPFEGKNKVVYCL